MESLAGPSEKGLECKGLTIIPPILVSLRGNSVRKEEGNGNKRVRISNFYTCNSFVCEANVLSLEKIESREIYIYIYYASMVIVWRSRFTRSRVDETVSISDFGESSSNVQHVGEIFLFEYNRKDFVQAAAKFDYDLIKEKLDRLDFYIKFSKLKKKKKGTRRVHIKGAPFHCI